jgi:preprotein translocase subunit YajC
MATIIFLGLFVLMWIVLIVPRQREIRRHQALMAQLEVGDEVMLGSGIYGVITSIEEDFLRLDVAPGVELKVAKRAVGAKVVAPSTGPAADTTDVLDATDSRSEAAALAPASDDDLTDDDTARRSTTESVDHPDVAGA